VYLDVDGTIVDTIPGLDAYAPLASQSLGAALGQLDGFGVISGATFRVDREDLLNDRGEPRAAALDARSFPETGLDCQSLASSVLLVDLEASATSEPLLPCRVAYQDDAAAGSTTRPALAVLPARGTVLAEGHRYAAVLTRALTSDGGTPVSAADAFAQIRDGKRRSTPTEKLYGEAIDRVLAEVSGLDRTRIVAIAPFTTQHVSRDLVRARQLVEGLPAPKLSFDPKEVAPMAPAVFTKTPTAVSTATLDAWLGAPATLPNGQEDPAIDQTTGYAHEAILAIATGVIDAPNFLLDDPSGYPSPRHRTWARDDAGRVIQNPAEPTRKVWVSLAIPDTPMPGNGYPVVILQHGLGGDRSFLFTMANTFAQHGWATVAIEALTFGARSTNPGFTTDAVSRFPWSGAPGAYAGPDGFVDKNATPLALFGELVNFTAMRDQFGQSAVDFGALAKMLDDPALDLGPLAAVRPGLKLDGQRIGYVGDSFGSVLGGLVAAIDTRIRAMVLNVGGGGILVELASNGPLLGSLVGPLGNLTFGLHGDRLNWRHPLVSVVQPIIDGADPLAYAPAFVNKPVVIQSTGEPKSVVIVEALWDELVSNEGTEALAHAAGIPLASPSTGPMTELLLKEAPEVDGAVSGVPTPGRTVVVVQTSPATHGCDLYCAHGKRTYAPPFVDAGEGFPTLPAPFDIAEPYVGLQAMATRFFATSFAGKVPEVGGFPTPVRDFDGDGVPDASDAAPLDPSKQ
jgi:dienelactone hydrolase